MRAKRTARSLVKDALGYPVFVNRPRFVQTHVRRADEAEIEFIRPGTHVYDKQDLANPRNRASTRVQLGSCLGHALSEY